MDVLIVAFHDPRSVAIGAQRTRSLAQHLHGLGSTVHLVTAGQYGDSCQLVRPGDDGEWTVIAGSPDPTAPIAPNEAAGVAPAMPSRVRERLSRLRGALLDRPDPVRERRWAVAATQLLRQTAALVPADVVVSSAPPWVTHSVAAQDAERRQVPWVPDYRDLWSNSPYFPYPAIRRAYDRRVERRLLARAAGVTTATPLSTAALQHDFAVTAAQTVLNGFVRDELDAVEAADLGPGRHLTYAGSWYGLRSDPTAILDAMALQDLADVVLHLVGTIPGPIDRLIRAHPQGQRVRRVGQRSRAESLAHVKGSDVAVLLLWNDPREASVLPGKLFEYIGLGKPVLATGYATGSAAQVLRTYGRGRFGNTADEVVAAVSWLTDPSRQQEPRVDAAQFEREIQNARWAQIVERAVAGGWQPPTQR